MGFALSAFHIAHLPCNSQFEARPNPLAREQPNANLLTFSVGHDADVRNLVFDQNLEVVPILMKFDKHSSLTVPLDDIHEDRIAQWIDDRIVAFIQTFLAIHQNLYYQKDTLVTDPVSGTQMPRYAAKCMLESGGKTYYFVSDATRQEFQDQQAAKG